ncbi:MAG: hypothetical protein ACOYO1_07520 [Bacteroidales bacterium]
MKDRLLKFIVKYEPLLFYIILLISLIPIVTPDVFHTLDGAAHLHNARLILELIKGNNFIEQFYQFNQLPVPNLSGHYILALLLTVFKVNTALKILLVAYYFLFCLSFRKMIFALKGQKAISYLIFPLAFSFFLLLGFFNFIIGFVFVFFGISLLFKENLNSKKYSFWIELFIWTTLIWFSHPILFLAWLIILAVFLFQHILNIYFNEHKFTIPYKLIFGLFIVVLPALLLSINYLNNYHGGNIRIYTPFKEKLIYLFNFRTLLLFNIPMERIYSIPMSIGLFLLLGYSYLKLFFEFKTIENKLIINAVLWGIAAFLVLLFYFVLPNEMSNGGYISDRLNYIFFIFLLIALIRIRPNAFILNILVVIFIIMHFSHLRYLYTPIKTISKQAELITKASDLVEDNKTLISINRSPEWFDGHMGNYIGINTAIYIQDNYEASKGYFPIVFNMNQLQELNLGLLTPYNCCIPLPNSTIHKAIPADYVLIIDNLSSENECDKSIYENLQKYYTLISDSSCKDFSLYKIK